jgi:hypothetical protein
MVKSNPRVAQKVNGGKHYYMKKGLQVLLHE